MQQPAPAESRLDLIDRLSALLACLIAAGLFYRLGWMIARPTDPFGPISLVGNPSPIITVLELAGLATVVSGIAAAVIRARLTDFGLFAAAVGLAAMNLRAGQIDQLMRYPPHGTSRGVILALLAVESLAWLIVVVPAAALGGLVESWFASAEPQDRPALLGAGRLLIRRSRPRPQPAQPANALACAVVCTALATALIYLTSGSLLSAIRKGQVYFSLAASFFLAALAAHQLSPTRSSLPALLAVPIVAFGGYLLGSINPFGSVPPTYRAIDHLMPNVLCRALPIEYFSAGLAGALAGTWCSHRLHRSRAQRRT